MQPLQAWCAAIGVLLALGLSGCPARHRLQVVLPQQPDAYDQWAASLGQEDAFYAELQRVQRLYSAEPDLALAAAGNWDGLYILSSRIENRRAGLVLTERTTQEQWVLWFYDQALAGDAAAARADAADSQASDAGSAARMYAPDTAPAMASQNAARLEVLRDEATAAGYALELSLNGGESSINITARWLQGRYLQCTRELTLGGLDQAQQADAAQTAWQLDGPWLPYRMVPGLCGPYGVVPDAEADGAWHSQEYPVAAMIPAVAAFDRTQGFLLAVSDDHPRKLDRRYELAYAIPRDMNAGAQISCRYTAYDGTQDDFDRPWLASGLPIRDSIVLERFTLRSKSADPGLVEAESAEVIQHLGDFVHAFHFVPRPPALPEPGAIVRAEQLPELAQQLGQPAMPAAGLVQAAGPCGARLCLVQAKAPGAAAGSSPAEPAPPANAAGKAMTQLGIDDTGVRGGTELAPEQLERIQQLKQGGLAVLAQTDLRQFSYSREKGAQTLPGAMPEWFIDASGAMLAPRPAGEPQEGPAGPPPAVQLNLRQPRAVAWLYRKLCDDLVRYPDVAGYALRLPAPAAGRREAGLAHPTPLTGSGDAQGALFQLHLGEVIRASRGDAVIVGETLPNLGCPVWCGILLPGAVAQAGASAPVPAHRLATYLLNSVFQAEPYLGSCWQPAPGELAPVVQRGAGTVHGMLLEPAGAAGFAPYALHQVELANSCGELRVVYSLPERNSYTGGPERPALCSKQITILPADWYGARAVWVCFSGIGGTMRVDKYNFVSISWENGGWTGKLPAGYWEIMHPGQGAAIQPGDAVLILFRPMAPLPSSGKPIG